MPETRLNVQTKLDDYIDRARRRDPGRSKRAVFEEIAAALDVSPHYVRRWYYDPLVPNPAYWLRIAKVIGITPAQLAADAERMQGRAA